MHEALQDLVRLDHQDVEACMPMPDRPHRIAVHDRRVQCGVCVTRSRGTGARLERRVRTRVCVDG